MPSTKSFAGGSEQVGVAPTLTLLHSIPSALILKQIQQHISQKSI